jgi:two-component system C4-dicarboxylate transport sensor histidine kinase DctB
VTVSVQEQEGRLRIAVKDRGEGIPDEVIPHIFEPFFTTKEGGAKGGLGLGLAVSHSLASALGGAIHVETGQGKGATFILSLPVEESPTP